MVKNVFQMVYEVNTFFMEYIYVLFTFSSIMSVSAPLFNNTLTTSIVLAETAKCKGVLPRESIALIFAPLSSNSWTLRKKLNNF